MNIVRIFDNGDKLISPVKTWYFMRSKVLFVRNCYKTELNKLINERSNSTDIFMILYNGTSGIGKSAYLEYLLAYFVFESNQQNITTTILYSAQADKSPVKYLFSTDGSISLYNGENVDYHLSDSVDITNFEHIKIGAVLVTSEKSSDSARFVKIGSSEYLCSEMAVWSFEELCEISPPAFTATEKELRYAIFGGSARNFLGVQKHLKSDESYDYVKEVMNWMFASEKLSMDADRWEFISNYIIVTLARNQNGAESSRFINVAHK
mmetsp:Transcript_6732/g.6040  ORF Transcript_6732/g.6040 Transcript_6732/m.6040 type:complete len:265 (+) Transcript_6732:269-1063(+)